MRPAQQTVRGARESNESQLLQRNNQLHQRCEAEQLGSLHDLQGLLEHQGVGSAHGNEAH